MQATAKTNPATEAWYHRPRFDGIRRLYTPEQVEEQRGSIAVDYTIAGDTAEAFHQHLRTLFARREQITTFGPYSPGQAVVMKRLGIDAIYLGGWATSAKGSATEDPGPDLASYPLSQVPDEAAPIVRALLTADRNQTFSLLHMSEAERAATPVIDYRPFIIADADTGHGGDAHVRNLIRRFVEIGVPGYHIEDQKPGVKKCGHQAGKVLVSQDEQIKRLNAARFQLDLMRVAGIIVARTDAEAATLLDGCGDERDHAFILGATNLEVPAFKIAYLAVMKRLFEAGLLAINGHLLYEVSDAAFAAASGWLQDVGLLGFIDARVKALIEPTALAVTRLWDDVSGKFADAWVDAARMKTYGEAVAELIRSRIDEGFRVDVGIEEWLGFCAHASLAEARAKARLLGLDTAWDCELPRTPDGYYQIQGGIECAIARSLNVAPYADVLWMETKTASLDDAAKYANAIHAAHPDKLLAYNLSPSFNWDTTGMSDDEMRRFPEELGRLGFVFNFITYGGHQFDGLAAEEFATALREDGMLALARLQRKLRLLNSPYRTPQALVGGPRADAGLMAVSGRTTTTKAMGKGSTHAQHMVQIEVPPKLLESWIELWKTRHGIAGRWSVSLRPQTAASDLLALTVRDEANDKIADLIFASIQDRRGRNIMSVRDQNNCREPWRRHRLLTLLHLFLVHRFRFGSVHYVSPTADNQAQARAMKALGFFDDVTSEIGHIIVAGVNATRIREWVDPDQTALKRLIADGALTASNQGAGR